ncbi:MAG: adenylate/guanylate cyclase domain-containing protein [Cyanobacteriota bacterium]|nr:adenylate/guanylate cyclase domain-containing protein [Cyanobacteriota bacterium]
MSFKLSTLLSLFQSRLSRKITWWIWISILAIEIIIFIPSYSRRKDELLLQLEEVSEASISTTIRLVRQGMYDESKLVETVETLLEKPIVLGVSVLRSDGEDLGEFGESPKLEFADIPDLDCFVCVRRWDGNRYDVVWSAQNLGVEYIFIVRHNASSIQPELYGFALRIAGLILIISVFVTFSTVLILGSTVIVPILKLRDNLNLAAELLSQGKEAPAEFCSISLDRQDELGEVMQAFCDMFDRVNREIQFRQQTENCLRNEREKSDRLLLNVLPEPIAERLKKGQNNIADGFSEVTILFADIVGFTQLSSRTSPKDLVNLLNDIFSEFDRLSQKYDLEKIKTIGDSYMVAGGLPIPREDSGEAIADMALEMQAQIDRFRRQLGENLSIRIGINTGSVVAGVIGTKKFIYDLWGDAVNTASRMESHGIPDKIQVTETTYQCLKHKYVFEKRGEIEVKGKGLMTTYLLSGKKSI